MNRRQIADSLFHGRRPTRILEHQASSSTLTGGWIVRSPLLEGLNQVLHEPVALISAPAGFGKTTLLSQWLDRCPLPNVWLQLDERNHEIPAFLAGIVAALR